MKRMLALATIFAALATGRAVAHAQAAAADPAQKAGQPVVLDRIIAVINGDVLLESDVQEEMRFAVLEPFSVAPGSDTSILAARRLANRTLILQQMRAQQHLDLAIPDDQVEASLNDVRNHLPVCRQFHCASAEGWKRFLAAHDLREDEVFAHWRQRLAILRFIDLRFRSGVRISHEEIQEYYEKSVLPVFKRQNEKPPPLDEVSQNIHEILLQQHVNVLLEDWLKSLHDEGSVKIIDPAYRESSENQNDSEDAD
jgi:hypothetical protein